MNSTTKNNTKIIRSTAQYCHGDESYKPMRGLHQRINHRAEYMGTYHIGICSPDTRDYSHEARKARYEEICLEKGIRPYGYSDSLWKEYLREVASEEHIAKCEAKNAWMYEY